ncbi:MAG: 2-dehydropantoate 2-reductase [Proteobacteria bacterium]|nr:2-dehydropantoate 2-reductase [Pseudomonadota bacterium]MDA0992631.1 2-dehydropantoate 2-reductase [Pseudomonadota bacterium]
MRICIYGAGAIGAWVGAELSLAGEDVTLIARGPHLKAMQENGVRLLIDGTERIAHPRCIENPGDAGPQDYVIITLKAHSLPGIADKIQPLLGPDTAVVTGVNGIPWWYFYKLKGSFENHKLESVDPGGKFWEAVGPERAIGIVVYPAAEIASPGVIRHIEGDRFTMGEPDGQLSSRAEKLCAAFLNAGFKSRVRNNIRDDIWVKLWGNLCFNPISALTLATLDKVAGEDGTGGICRLMMLEAQEIGEKLGATFRVDVDRRLAGGAAVGAHKTSMLQDLELGRPMEIDALVTVVQELGKLVGVPTPTVDVVLALVQQRARVAGTY